MSAAHIHALRDGDYDDWRALYCAYAAFYKQPQPTDALLQTAWQWLADGALHGAIARTADGKPAGLAHWEFILRPLRGVRLSYLHDLYVHTALRGNGYGRQLLAHVGVEAKKRGCQHVRWLTKVDNTAARWLYDKHAAAATDWVLYQQSVAGND